MVFTLLVCADICGHKLNCEIPFAAPPTLAELKQRADLVFHEEAQALNRQGRLTTAASELLYSTVIAPGFDGHGGYTESGLLSLGRIQVYDDSMLRWIDLVSPSQLHEYDQIYIFPKHRAHLSQVRDLPPPQPTGAAVIRSQVGDSSHSLARSMAAANSGNATGAPNGVTSSPSRHMNTSVNIPPASNNSNLIEHSPARYNNSAIGSRAGGAGAGTGGTGALVEFDSRNPSFHLSVEEMDKRQRQIFKICDSDGNNYVSIEEFRALFNRTKVLFNDVTVTELFAMHSANGRFITFSEWQIFTRNFPQLFAAMYRRLSETQAETDMSNELELGAKRLVGLRDELEELTRRLEAVRKEIDSQERRSRDVAERLAETRGRRAPVEEEEQVILEKEVRIHFQREMLSREENELRAATRRLDERTAVAASRGDVRRY